MISNSIKSIIGVSILIGTLIGCGGGAGGAAPSAIKLEIVGDNDMALNGSQEIAISIKSSTNVTYPVNIAITNSDSSVVSILQNNCQKSFTEKSGRCSIFIRGDKIGKANITATVIGYTEQVIPINVAKQWGSIGGGLGGIDQLSLAGNKIYALSGAYVYMSENGSKWQKVGGGEAFDSKHFKGSDLLSNGSYVCITSINDSNSQSSSHVSVKCSKNGSNWQEVGNFDEGIGTDVRISWSSIYKDKIYISVWHQGSGASLSFCSIDNCNGWQEFGERLSSDLYQLPIGMYNKTVITSDQTKTYYLSNNGNWKLHSNYPKNNLDNWNAINNLGFFILSISEENQQKIYNSRNLGDAFVNISGDLKINRSLGILAYPTFATLNNNVFATLGDGNIYFSTNIDSNNWTEWKQVGNNNIKLIKVYANDKNLYSINRRGDMVYVYSLQ